MNIHEYLMSLEPDTTAPDPIDVAIRDEFDELHATITRLGIALADALEQLANQ